jgi:hypothetical protein
MALHQMIQRCLLVGVDLGGAAAPRSAVPPDRLRALIEAMAGPHARYDGLAVKFGHRYRSAFWSVYFLSAIAVLFAVMPLALGWDDSRHTMHPWLFLWALGEVVIILVVGGIYIIGHRQDWQGQWLWARTQAELTWYLPLIAPLVDFNAGETGGNWYGRVYASGSSLHPDAEVEQLCVAKEDLARESLAGAWSDAGFVADYARFTIDVLTGQRHYHARVARRQRALLKRVHGLNARLFAITAVCAIAHLVIHTLWLSVVTTFLPALGASLHGALAQSEAYRLAVTSERLDGELKTSIERIEAATAAAGADAEQGIRTAVRDAIGVILEEHQDWHMLVRPHHLPLG